MLPELFKEYLLAKTPPSSKVTVKNYLSDVRAFIKWFEDTFKTVFDPGAVSIKVIEDYITQASTSTRSNKRYLSSLRRFFAFLEESQRIQASPFQKTEEEKPEADPWQVSEFKNFLFTQGASHLTIKNYVIDIRSFRKWYETTIGTLFSAKDINPGILYEYRQRLIHASNFAPRSVNRKLSSLRRFIAFAQGQAPSIIEQTEIEIAKPASGGIKLENIAEAEKPNTRSKIAPVRLASPIFTLYSRLEEKGAEKIIKLVKTVNIPSFGVFSKSIKKLSAKGGLQMPIIRNVEKEFYAAHMVSTASYPFHKKVYHHLRFTRPNWYKRYHNYAFAHYFHFALLVVYASGVGFMLYQGIFAEPTRNKTLAAPAQPLKVYSFQGRLTDITDSPITTSKQVRFMVYNSSAATGAAELWEEVRTISPDTDGIFSVLLASAVNGTNAADCGAMPPASPVTGACGIPQSLFRDNSQLFLGVTIGNDTELTPRQQIATVAYATNAEVLQGLPPITQASAGTTNVVLALDSSGNLTIGGSANPIFSASGGTFTLTGQPLLLKTNASSNGNIQLVPDGLGKIDIQKPIVNFSNSGNLSPGAVEVDDKFSVLATESAVAAFVINNNTAGGDIFTASSSGTPKFTIQNDGTIVSGKYTSQNGVLYGAQTTGVLTQATTASTGFCLLSGASNPSWSACPGGADAYWNQQNGSLFANNSTVDFLAGGQSTGSAAFRVTGQANPFRGTLSAASVSANTSFAGFVTDNKGVGDLFAASSSGVPSFVVKNNGDVVVGSAGLGKLTAAVLDPYLVQNQKTTGTITLTLQTMGGAGADIIFQNQSTDLMHILQTGNVGIGVANPTGGKLQVAGDIVPEASGTRNLGTPSLVFNNVYATNVFSTGGISGFWQQGSGSLFPLNSTLDFFIGGQATLSAKFAVLNMNSGTPTASVSATSTGTGLALGGDGTIQSLRNNMLTVGGATTGDIQFKPGNASTPSLYVQTGGNVGIGTAAPVGPLHVFSNISSPASPRDSATAYFGRYGTAGNVFAWLGVDQANGGSASIGVRNYATNYGNLLLMPDGGSVGIGSAAPIGGLYVTHPLTAGAIGKAVAVFDQYESQDILTASAAGVPKFSITNGGGIKLGTSVGTGSQCITGGATAAWGTCGSGNSPFQELSGAIVPNNSTEDFLLGSQATLSAKFAVLNINSGTPTASVSATATGAGLALGGDGTIQSLRNNMLTIGGATTGDIQFKPGNASTPSLYLQTGGNVGIGIANPSTLQQNIVNSAGIATALTLQNINAALNSGTALDFSNFSGTQANNQTARIIAIRTNSPAGGSTDLQFWTYNTGLSQQMVIQSTGNVGIGTTAPLGELHVSRPLSFGANGRALAIFDQIENMDILTASAAGTPVFTITRAGGIGLGATTGVGTNTQCLLGGATASWGSCAAGTNTSPFQQGTGFIYPNNATVDFVLGSQATLSAKFAVLNINSGTPTASVSATATGAGLALGGDGTIQSLRNNTLTIGGATTGDIGFKPGGAATPTLYAQTGGFVGVGTVAPAFRLDVQRDTAVTNGEHPIFSVTDSTAGDNGIRIGYTADGASVTSGYIRSTNSNTLRLATSGTIGSGGAINILNAGNVGIGTTAPTALLDVAGAASVGGQLKFRSGTAQIQSTASQTLTIGGDTTGNIALLPRNSAGFVGVNLSNPTSPLTVEGNVELGNGSSTRQIVEYNAARTNHGTVEPYNLATGNLTLSTDFASGNIVLTPGASGSEQFTNFTSNGGVLYTNGTGVLAQATAGTSSQCLLGGTTPSFGSCATGTSDSFWNSSNGLLYPNNSTVDFAIGGQATLSAKFAVLNINSGTPTASVSATATGTGTVIGGDGSIQSLINSSLSIGGNTTGEIAFYTHSTFVRNSGRIGNNNTSLGVWSANALTSGNQNTFIGVSAGLLTTTGSFNTYVGDHSGQNDTAQFNTFLGSTSGSSATSGNSNTLIGYSAGSTIITGTNSVIVGANADVVTNNLTNANAFGYSAIVNASNALVLGGTGANAVQVGIGTQIPLGLLDLEGGTMGGNAALIINQKGASTNDILTASASGVTKFTVKNDGTASSSAGFTIDGTGNIQSTKNQTLTVGGNMSGLLVLKSLNNTVFQNPGTGNIFVGAAAGGTVNTGSHNAFVGFQAGNANTSGSFNVFLGDSAGFLNTSGSNNEFIGMQTGSANTIGAHNIFLGNSSGLSNVSGNANTFIGENSGFTNTASNNTFIGNSAGYSNSSGTGNTFIGYFAGDTATGANANTTGGNNTFIGYQAGPGTTTQLTNASALGYQALVSTSNSLVLGGTGANLVNVGIGTTTPISPLQVVGGVMGGNAALIVNQTGASTNDILTASASGTPIFSVTNAGGIKLGTSVGTGSQCITGGATASWGTCGGGGGSNWTLSTANGTLSPNNNTLDFLLGGIATTSAKFAVLNMNGTGPATATVSGNLIAMPRNGAGGMIGIGTINPVAPLTAQSRNDTAVFGAEKITNVNDTTFAVDTGNWTGSSWHVNIAASGVAAKDVPGPNAITLTNAALDSAAVAGSVYRVKFDVTTTASSTGTLTPSFGSTNGQAIGNDVNMFWTENQLITAAGTGALTFTPTTGWYGTIDNISVKKMTGTNSVASILNSDGVLGVEIRSGGSNGSTLNNSFYGIGIGQFNTTGYENTAVGDQWTLQSNTTGHENGAFGTGALEFNTTGYRNNAFGNWALNLTTTGYHNSAYGNFALQHTTTGFQNSAIGSSALVGNTTGANNSALGYLSLQSNTTGTNNTAIGTSADVSAGNLTNATAIGYSAIVGASNSLVLGGTGGNAVNVGIGTATPQTLLDIQNASTAVASISATTNGTGLALGGGGTIQALRNNTLTIGGNTTGSIFISPSNASGFTFVGSASKNIAMFNTGAGLDINYTAGNSLFFGYDKLAGSDVVVGGTGGDYARLGVGVAAPTAKFQIWSTLATTPVASISGRTTDATLKITQEGTGDFIVASSAGNTKFRIRSDGSGIFGDYNGTNSNSKIFASGVDPLYTIDGKRYSTFAPSILGMKEEMAGKVNTAYNSQEQAYIYTLDLGTPAFQSDAWVFSRIIDPNLDLVSVLMSSSSQAKTWYKTNSNSRTIKFYSDKPTEISYRLTAPRFDSQKWPTISTDYDVSGIIAPPPTAPSGSNQTNPDDSFFTGVSISLRNGVYELTDSLGNSISKVDAFSKTKIADLTAGIINTQQTVTNNLTATTATIGQLATNSLNVTADSVSIAGQSLKNYIIQTVSNSGLAINSSNGIVSPLASIDEIHTNLLSPLAGPDIALKGSLNVKDTNGNIVARIDTFGNASFSGQLSSTSVQTNSASISGNLAASSVQTNNASVSGILNAGRIVADSITANSIEGLDARVATLTANFITSVSNPSSTTHNGSAFGNLVPGINTNYVDISSFSAQFATITDGLIALGPTTLNQATILDSLSIGTNLTIGVNSINLLGGDLEIQPLKQGGVSFLAGLVHIDTEGNLDVQGNATFAKDVTIHGKLSSNIISPLPNQDLAVSIPDSRFKIQDSSGSAVLSINNSGDLVASGSGTFDKLNLSFAPPVYAADLTTATASGSAGTAFIKPGHTELTIQNPNVTDKSLIYITPVGQNTQVYLLRQVAKGPALSGVEGSFSVGTPLPALQDIQFNWIIVN